MERLSKKEQDVFFDIIRSAIWNRPLDHEIGNDVNWDALIGAFQEHSVLSIVANRLIVLSMQHPALAAMIDDKVLNSIGHVTRAHHCLDTAIKECFSKLESEGLHPVLLKGQALARLYPEGCLRPFGDIDILLSQEEFERGCCVVSEMLGKEVDREQLETCDVHYHVNANNITYEIHHCIINNNNKFLGNTRVARQLTNEMLSATEYPAITLDGYEVRIPSRRFTNWFIFYHLYKHYKLVVGIRQFIDWLQVIRTYDPATEEADLRRDLETIGMTKEWNELGYVLTHYLGLPVESFPLYDAASHKIPQHHIDNIVHSGDFGLNIFEHRKMEYGPKRALIALFCYTKDIYRAAREESISYAIGKYMQNLKYGITNYFKVRK